VEDCVEDLDDDDVKADEELVVVTSGLALWRASQYGSMFAVKNMIDEKISGPSLVRVLVMTRLSDENSRSDGQELM
jgi:hypothetical protein